MKRFIRILSGCFFALLILFLSSDPSLADTSHITFTNEPTEQPDLYVTKTVSSAVEGYEIPDIAFTFTLKWDLDRDGTLSYAANEVYTVYEEDGTQVKNYDSYGSETSFKTDSAGRFTLKAGQTAKFEYVGSGISYEITEADPGENWTQVSPANGLSATGTVDENGTMVTFENLYVPTSDVDPGEDETTLSVSKYTVDVDGNSYDTDETFTFTVTVGYEPLSNYAYTVYDLSGNEVGSGTTDENGSFAISGNQKAVFEEIILNEDYSVTEADSDDWSCVTGSSVEGGTVYPIVYTSFTNQVKGGYLSLTKVNPDEEVLEGASFGIYSDETCSNLVAEMTTGADGTATSKELTPGTYYVKETAAPEGYALSSEIYTVDVASNETSYVGDDGKVVNTGGSAVLTLVKADAEDESKLLADAEFGIYSDQDCEILLEEITTDADGYAESQKLDVGTYYVKEITAPDGYMRSDTVYTVTIDGKTQSVAVSEDPILNEKAQGSITLIKKDGNGNLLSGVTFELVSKDGSITEEGTTGTDGTVVFDELPAGTYTITETKTVSGQQLLAEALTVVIPLEMTQEEVDEQGNVDTSKAEEIDGVYYFYNLTYEITNTANLTMPTSGGNGYVYGLAGALILFLAGMYLVIKRRKESI